MPETPVQMPIALPRSSAGNSSVTIASVAGISSAAPIPCAMRESSAHVASGARPTPALATVKIATPSRNIRRRPKMSHRRPPVTSITASVSVYPLTIHCSVTVVVCRLRWIAGSATLTAVLSSMIMKRAPHIAPSAHQRRLPAAVAPDVVAPAAVPPAAVAPDAVPPDVIPTDSLSMAPVLSLIPASPLSGCAQPEPCSTRHGLLSNTVAPTADPLDPGRRGALIIAVKRSCG